MAKQDDKSQKDWEEVAEQTVEDEIDEAAEALEEDVPDDVPAGVLEHPSYKALEAKLTEAEAKAHENWDKALRAASELENYRNRAEREVGNARKFSIERFAGDLLPVIDSLEQALSATEKGSEALVHMREGVELTLKMFQDALAKFSVESIDPAGELFDPGLHEAMSMLPAADAEPNTVLQVLQKGYKLHDRVLRPARVIVAKGEAESVDKEV